MQNSKSEIDLVVKFVIATSENIETPSKPPSKTPSSFCKIVKPSLLPL